MENCEQTEGLSVLAHGYSVAEHYADIHSHLTSGSALKLMWRLPVWLESKEFREALVSRLLPFGLVQTYQIYHDCGKPYCITFDEEGKRHFPNHAEVSFRIWKENGGCELVADLMRMDMDAHLLKAAGVPEFSSRKEAATLLLTALAEVHANAAMFGGLESSSFKMKWKHLQRRGKAICKVWLSSEANEPSI